MAAIIYNSGVFFDLAKNSCERSKRDDREAIVAIILSATALEAFLNELTEDSASHLNSSVCFDEVAIVGRVLSQLEDHRVQLSEKLQMAHLILKRELLNKGAEPYQSFQLLVRLRNMLVHNKPEGWMPDQFGPHNCIKQLADKGIIPSPPPDSRPQLFSVLCRPEVAQWSYNVAIRMLKFVIDLVPAGGFRDSLILENQGLSELP